jgi:hypothetical protein
MHNPALLLPPCIFLSYLLASLYYWRDRPNRLANRFVAVMSLAADCQIGSFGGCTGCARPQCHSSTYASLISRTGVSAESHRNQTNNRKCEFLVAQSRPKALRAAGRTQAWR